MNHEKLAIHDNIRKYILQKLVEPAYIRDVDLAIKGKTRWNIIGQAFETLSKIFLASSGILSFASGFYSNQHLSFVAGSVCTISLACLQFSSFCFKETKQNETNLNTILDNLNIEAVPELNVGIHNKQEQIEILMNLLNDIKRNKQQLEQSRETSRVEIPNPIYSEGTNSLKECEI
jgi:hypothetical protein